MKRNLIIIALLAALIPSVLLAQDEITLESLAESFTDLAETVESLVTRVNDLEAIYDGPGAEETGDGGCAIAYASIGDDPLIQDSTVLAYKEAFDEWLSTDEVSILGVKQLPDSGQTVVVYTHLWTDRTVAETWEGCDFVGASEWQEEE